MIKNHIAVIALIFFASSHAGQPKPLAVNANIKVTDIPRIPLSLEFNVHPQTLVSGLGFAGCLAALQLYKQGAQLCACQDADLKIKKAKQDEGDALINRSYILFAASAAAIFNKQILGIFIKQGQ